MCVRRVHSPQPGSESGADVQKVMRERVRAQCLWSNIPAERTGWVTNTPGCYPVLRRNRGESTTKIGAHLQYREQSRSKANGKGIEQS